MNEQGYGVTCAVCDFKPDSIPGGQRPPMLCLEQ